MAFLHQLGDALSQQATVTEVHPVVATCSILIRHTGELGPILEQAQARGLFELRPPPRRNPMRRLQRAIERADARLSEQTNEALSLSSLTFVALVGAGVWQAAHGRLLPAGTSLFNYAFKVLEWVAVHEPPLEEDVSTP